MNPTADVITWTEQRSFTGSREVVGRIGMVAFFWIGAEGVTGRTDMENKVPGQRQRITRHADEDAAKDAAEQVIDQFMADTGFHF